MKRVWAAIGPTTIRWSITTTMAMGLAGCGMENPGGPDASWIQVTEQTSCEAMVPSYCRGLYGFTVMNDGRYTVGPDPTGAQVSGSLTDSERSRISADAALVAGGLGASQECDGAGTVPGVGDHVDLMNSRGVVSRVFELGVRSTCYRGGRGRAIQLQADLQALMAKYYPGVTSRCGYSTQDQVKRSMRPPGIQL